jgi:GNAT superfamily N-acetyltransferase
MMCAQSRQAALACSIREADDADMALCAALRPVYTTDSVYRVHQANELAWQRKVAGSADIEGPVLSFMLERVRLPRKRTILLPSSTVPLTDIWDTCSARLLIASDEHVFAYLLMRALPEQRQGWIVRLLVDVPARRRGFGKALLRTARAWARAEGLLSLTAHTPLRNVSGIRFYQHCGFRICGLSEQFYPTREDSLLLSQAV